MSTAAQAAITANKSFAPSSIVKGGTSTLTITLANSNTSAATGAAFTDSLPSGLVVANPNNLTNSCGGTATAAAGSGTVSLSGGTVGPNGGTCTLTVAVTSSALGNYTNTIPAGGVTTSQGNNSVATTVSLAVVSPQPVVTSGSVSPSGQVLMGLGPTQRVTLTLTNPNAIQLTNVSVQAIGANAPYAADVFSKIASPANIVSTCGGTAVITANPNVIQISGATLAANGSCTLSYDIAAITPSGFGSFCDQVGYFVNFTSDQGVPASGSGAGWCVMTGVTVQKGFSPNPIFSGQVSTLSIQVINGDIAALSGVSFTDTLPSGMTVAAPANASTTCTGGTLIAIPGSSTVQLSGASVVAATPSGNGTAGQCYVTVDVTATNTTSQAVTYTNTIPAGNFNGTPYASNGASLTVNPREISGDKFFDGAQCAGCTATMHIVLRNTFATPATITSLTDDLTTMAASGFTVGSTPAPTTTCTGAVVNAPPGGTLITVTGGVIPAGTSPTAPGQCTIDVPVALALSLPYAIFTNTIPVGKVQTTLGSNTRPIQGSVQSNSPIGAYKSFDIGAGEPGAIVNTTITLGSSTQTPLTNVSINDPLPAGLVFAPSPNLSTTCPNGNVSISGSTMSLTGATLAPGANCTITFALQIAAGTPDGTVTNQPSLPTATNVTSSFSLPASIFVSNAKIALSKSFMPATLSNASSTSQLAIQFDNRSTNAITATLSNLTDALPAGLVVANPANASFTGSGCTGTVAAAPGAGSVVLSNAQINGGASCTLTVTVQPTAAGTYPNIIPAGAITSRQNVSTGATAAATLLVNGSADLSITKDDGVTQVAAGTTTTYTITVNNAGPDNVAGGVVDDTPPPGMTITGWTCAATGGSTCGAASGSGTIHDTFFINKLTTVTYTVTALVASNYIPTHGSSVANTATVTVPGTVSDPNPNNNTATDTDTVVQGVVFALTKTDNSTTYTPGGTATYTITAKNTGAANATQVNIIDSLPPGVTLNGVVTCTPSGTSTCGTVTGAVGQAQFTASGATLPANSGGTLTFSVPVKFASNMTTAILTNTVNATDVPSNATGSASDGDDFIAPSADVSVVKSGPQAVLPGAPIQYTLKISNAGPSDANNTTFNDAVPAAITGVTATCGSPTGGAACPGSVTVTGNTVSGVVTTLPAGGSVTITINGTTSPTNGTAVTNTATITPPNSVTDTNTGNNTSAVTTVITPILHITKTADTTQLVPGGTVHYTITVTNPGPAAASSVLVTDPVAAGIASQTWTCAGTGGATCAASGSGAINDTIATFPAGGSAVYTVTATISNTPPTNVINTATATTPNNANVCAPANTPAPCSASASIPPVPQVGISKTADVTTVTAGSTIHYTITVSNTGVMSADNTPVSDPIPTGIVSQTWTCTASGGATCTASGTGAISDTITTFPAGSFVTYTVTATVSATPPASITNTATATPTGSALCTPGNTAPPCSATATVSSDPLISIAKTADTSMLVPGGTVHYTITVTNNGAVAANGTTVSDAIPTGIASQTWTCAANAGATCAASGTGAISDTITTFPAGSFVTYSVTATVDATPPATVTNTASATPSTGGTCAPSGSAPPCTATATGNTAPKIQITKTADATTVAPNGTVHYTITVSNTGAAAADGTTVSDPIPTGIASQTWTCVGSSGATCTASGAGAISDTITTFPSGGFVTYTVTATVNATPPAKVSNTATADPPNSGVCAPSNTAGPCTATVNVSSVPLVHITKSVDKNVVLPGDTLHYTVVVSNTGTVAADGTAVSDPIPTGIASQTWTCAASGGATCTASGNGAVSDTITTFPVGSSVTYTVTATVDATPPASISNTATATPPAGGLCNPGNTNPPCVGTVTIGSAPRISITKTADTTSVAPNGTIHYTVTVNNAGSVAANGTTVSDPIPTGIASQSWTCAASGGATCTASGSGAVSDTIATFPAGSSVTFTVVATASATPPATVTNTASATPPSGVCSPGNTAPPCTATVNLSSVPLIGITKTADVSSVYANGTIHYTVTVTNAGSASAGGTTVSDPISTGIASQTWICAASGGATCAASGTGAISDTIATFPVGSSATYTVTATVDAAPPTTIANVASATPPQNGLCMPGSTLPPCTATVNTSASIQRPQVGITKTADAQTVTAGGTIHYTVKVTNSGAVSANGAMISDPIPAGIANQTWTCVASGGATCAASGTGAVTDTIATFPVGSSVTYVVTAVVMGVNPPSTISNVATTTPPTNGTCSPCSATATTTVQLIPAVPAPTLSVWMLLWLSASMAGATWLVVSRHRV